MVNIHVILRQTFQSCRHLLLNSREDKSLCKLSEETTTDSGKRLDHRGTEVSMDKEYPYLPKEATFSKRRLPLEIGS